MCFLNNDWLWWAQYCEVDKFQWLRPIFDQANKLAGKSFSAEIVSKKQVPS